MKVIIDGYEVEIKAKKVGKNKANIKDTMHILSMIEGWAWDSANLSDREGFPILANATRKEASHIHETLDSYGYFDNIRRAN